MSFIAEINPLRAAKSLLRRAVRLVSSKPILLSSLGPSSADVCAKAAHGLPLLLGRAPQDLVDVSLSGQVPMPIYVSKRHLLLYWEPKAEKWTVLDISQQGASIEKKNGAVSPLQGKGWQLIDEGDVLVFSGQLRIKFDLPADVLRTVRKNRGAADVLVDLDLTSVTPGPDNILYFKLQDPSRLIWGMNIPGLRGGENIALREDQETTEFLAQIKSKFSGIKNKKELAKKIYEYVRDYFQKTFEDTEEGWKEVARRYDDAKVSLGYFLGIRSGCCRHQAAALALAYQEMGLTAKYVRGRHKKYSKGRHAWVEIEYNGKWYIADTMPMGGFMAAADFLDADSERIFYVKGENTIEVPLKDPDAPGRNGTALLPCLSL